MDATDVKDLSFKDRMSSWIYNDRKLITFHYISQVFGVHVNVGKQMLFEFYQEESNRKLKCSELDDSIKIRALYYVSGLKPEPLGKESTSYTATICRDDNLASVKASFSSLHSIHVYGIEASKENAEGDDVEDSVMKKLSRAVAELSVAREDNQSPIQLGPYKETHQLRPRIDRPSTSLETKSETIIKQRRPSPGPIRNEKTEENNEKSTNSKKVLPDAGSDKVKPGSSRSSSSSSKGKPNQLKSMFSAAASKQAAKPKIKDDPQEESKKQTLKPKVKEEPREQIKNSSKNTKSESKTGEKVSRKRKRIRDILSSDEDEAEEDPQQYHKKSNIISSDDEDSDPGVTKRRSLRRSIRMLVDSESEDEIVKPIETSPPTPPPKSALLNMCVPAVKKRKTKTITSQLMDDDGYLVTKREKVDDSDSEPCADDEDNNNTPLKDKLPEKRQETLAPIKRSQSDGDKDKNTSKSTPPKGKSSSVGAGSKKSPAGGNTKIKQSRLTSFFIKRT